MDYLSENEMITDYARELKINVLQNELEDFITLATQENWGCRTLIARILEKGGKTKKAKGKDSRVPTNEVSPGTGKGGFARRRTDDHT